MSRPRAVLVLAEEDNRSLSRREDNLLKPRFLEALTRNDAVEVAKILRTTSIDIDTVLDVEDRDMILASYKQGNSCWRHNSRSFTRDHDNVWLQLVIQPQSGARLPKTD